MEYINACTECYQNVPCTDLSSCEKYYAGSRDERISRLALNAEMWPSAQVRVFCRGRGASSPRKFYIFYLVKCYLKQQITPGLGKTKGDISEIYIQCIFQSPDNRFRHKQTHFYDYSLVHRLARSQKAWQYCIKKSRKHTSWPQI